MRGGRRILLASVVACAICACGSPTNPSAPQSQPPLNPASFWSDEFDGPANATPDPAKWTYDVGSGWGIQELQTYTNAPENARLDGRGHLVIQSDSASTDSASTGFTSARLKTKGLFAAQYGRIEARIEVPFGQGIWPAFWMLGDDCNEMNWPACGEVDIMENIGAEPATIHGSIHGPGYSGWNTTSAPFALSNQKFSDDFHTFAIEWVPHRITFYVDNRSYLTVTPSSLPSGVQWVFDKPFYLLLNVAVGGSYPGPPDSTTRFPQQMLVDYVRYTR
jgi:beta-glucanase (GH16 family)